MKGDKMSQEWKCRKCGYLNTGRVSGMAYGSFSDFIPQAQEAADKAQMKCTSCGAARSLTGRKSLLKAILLILGIGCFIVGAIGLFMTLGGLALFFRGEPNSGNLFLKGIPCLILGFGAGILLAALRDHI
jgi:hypothetical protein